LGIALLAAREFEAAEAAFDRTLQLRADWPVARYNKGRAAAGQGRHQDAVDCYRRAANGLARPQPQLLAHLANSLQELGQSSEALEHWDLALGLDPDYAQAHCGRGSTLGRLKRSTDALLSFDRALALNAGLCEAHHGRGELLAELKRPAEALVSYECALELNPRYAHAHCGRGNALYVLRRPSEGLAAYERALALDADYAQAYCGRGNCLHELKRQGEALTSFERALALNPEYSEAYHGRGNALSDLKRHCEALESYERAVSVGTTEPCLSLAGALNMASMMCDWAALERVKAYLSWEPTGAYTPFPIVCVLDDPALQQSTAQQFISHFAPGVNATSDARNPLGTAQGSSPLRIGYLSADFRLHPIAFLISELVEIHDRTRFRIYGFSAGIDDGSPERARLQNAFDVFIDVRSKSNSDLVRLIREAEIDVLVELGGHTGDSRMFALVERAAPIQITYLGYPATTGAPFIDYAIVDRFVVPEGSEKFFTEKLVYMPDCFHVTDRKRCVSERTPLRAECGLPEAGFVFCCFNNSYKISPSVFDVWVRLLNAVPESVLWLVGETRGCAKTYAKRRRPVGQIQPASSSHPKSRAPNTWHANPWPTFSSTHGLITPARPRAMPFGSACPS
jgi:predicted O-linked N-acetylglucosamine transferase (SPINDLY family)